MVKKVFVGVLLAAAFGLLVFGAVNRTLAKSADNQALALNDSVQEGYGGGHGTGNTVTSQSRILDGGVDDTIADGEYLGAYNGEDAGYGPGDGTGNGIAPEDGTGYGLANPNGGQGKQPEDAPQDGSHDGIADVSDWITVSGTVQSVSSYEVVISLDDGSSLVLDGRTLAFMTESGFVLSVGDSVTILGFYDDGVFETGQVTTASGSIMIREDDGTPLWASSGMNTGSGQCENSSGSGMNTGSGQCGNSSSGGGRH
jgi:hypothetical protein